jgi:hypothetical protein
MSVQLPLLTFQADLSSNQVTIGITPPGAVAYPYLTLTTAQQDFFGASGIGFARSVDASGVSTAVTGLARDNVQAASLAASMTAGRVAWANAAAGVVDVAYRFNDGAPLGMRFDIAHASGLLGSSSLARHLILMAVHAYKTKRPAALEEFIGVLSANETALQASVSAAIASVLSLQAAQNLLLDAVLTANGPLVNDTDASGDVPYTASMEGLDLMFALRNVRVGFALGGGAAKTITLAEVPVLVRLRAAAP